MMKSKKKKGILLHQLEFVALCMCWFTFWGGLLFYLGHETPGSVPIEILQTMSIVIILANVSFLLFALYQFFKEFLMDLKHEKELKKRHSSVAVVPVPEFIASTNVRMWKGDDPGASANKAN